MPNDDLMQSAAARAAAGNLGDERPDLGPIRALAEREEFADARSRLADSRGCSLRADDPLMPLACALAESLTEAGFTLHHCLRSHPLCRLGGVCLLPVPRSLDPGGHGGVVVSWTTHDLLGRDWDRWGEYRDVIEAMSHALAMVLDAHEYEVQPFGSGGASLVTSSRSGGLVAR